MLEVPKRPPSRSLSRSRVLAALRRVAIGSHSLLRARRGAWFPLGLSATSPCSRPRRRATLREAGSRLAFQVASSSRCRLFVRRSGYTGAPPRWLRLARAPAPLLQPHLLGLARRAGSPGAARCAPRWPAPSLRRSEGCAEALRAPSATASSRRALRQRRTRGGAASPGADLANDAAPALRGALPAASRGPPARPPAPAACSGLSPPHRVRRAAPAGARAGPRRAARARAPLCRPTSPRPRLRESGRSSPRWRRSATPTSSARRAFARGPIDLLVWPGPFPTTFGSPKSRGRRLRR